MTLPPEVRRVLKPSGRAYYYWHPHRGTKREGKAVSLGSDPQAPAFWEKVRQLGGQRTEAPHGSIAWLVALYRASQTYADKATSTRSTYDVHLDRFASPEGWGHLAAPGLEARHIMNERDAMVETPVMANQMLSVGRALWDWGAPLGYLGRRPFNPFEIVPDLHVEDRGHVPWPEWAQDHVVACAPADLVRMMRLALMTCQRESDFVRLGPAQRDGNGIWCRPIKTRKRRRSFRIPLLLTDALELDRWATTPIRFENSRWKAPIERHHPDLYLCTPRGQPYTPVRLRARWSRWLATTAGTDLCKRWHEWLTKQVERYDWDIDPEDVRGPTIHGLRGTGVLLRFSQGFDDQQISNDIGMSLPMVQRYIRFRDQVDVAEAGRWKLQIA